MNEPAPADSVEAKVNRMERVLSSVVEIIGALKEKVIQPNPDEPEEKQPYVSEGEPEPKKRKVEEEVQDVSDVPVSGGDIPQLNQDRLRFSNLVISPLLKDGGFLVSPDEIQYIVNMIRERRRR